MKNKGTKKISIQTLLAYFAPLAAVFLILGLCAYYYSTQNVTTMRVRTSDSLAAVTDYSFRESASEEAPVGVVQYYTIALEDYVDYDTCLAFYSVNQQVNIYVDGELMYSLSPCEENRIGKSVGSNWVMMPLCRDDGSSVVEVEIIPVYENARGFEPEFLIGSYMEIYQSVLRQSLPMVLLSIAAILIGLFYVVLGIYYRIKKLAHNHVEMLGLFSILIGLWRLSDSLVAPFVMEQRPVLLYFISIAVLMLPMIALVLFVRKKEEKPLYLNLYCIAAAMTGIVQLLLHAFNVVDLRDSLEITHAMIVAGAVVFVVALVRTRFVLRTANLLFFSAAILCIVGGGIDLLLFYLRKSSADLVFSLIGFLLYVLITGTVTIREYREYGKKLQMQTVELENSRIIAATGQIRTHFVFNVLNAISGMCKYDPQKADDTVVRFARFLRTNINLMSEDKPLAFEVALRHLEDYIALEQIRFGDMIRFEKNIGFTDFKIPLLLMQLVVENAIKHGLRPKNAAGTIRLTTEEKDGMAHICIEDDGVGFRMEERKQKGSVGLKNVQFRLEHLSNGEMEIVSKPGKGTKVTMKIPYKEN